MTDPEWYQGVCYICGLHGPVMYDKARHHWYCERHLEDQTPPKEEQLDGG